VILEENNVNKTVKKHKSKNANKGNSNAKQSSANVKVIAPLMSATNSAKLTLTYVLPK
jgi:hypothetical protein